MYFIIRIALKGFAHCKTDSYDAKKYLKLLIFLKNNKNTLNFKQPPKYFYQISFHRLQQYQCQQMQKDKKQIWKRYPYLFNKHKNITFQCFCQRYYSSFPALYLHCQRKHKKKISANLVKTQCQSARDQWTQTAAYQLNQDGILIEKQVPYHLTDLKRMKEMFGEFMEKDTIKSEITSISKELSCQKADRARAIRSFEKYLTSNAASISADSNHLIENIPFHFNSFMGEQVFLIGSQQYAIFKEALFELGEWMNKKSYTSLTTLKNEQTEDVSL